MKKLVIDMVTLCNLFKSLTSQMIGTELSESEIKSISKRYGFSTYSIVSLNLLPYLKTNWSNSLLVNDNKYKLKDSPYNHKMMSAEFIKFIDGKKSLKSNNKSDVKLKSDSIELDREVYYMSNNKIAKGTIVGMFKYHPSESELTYMVYDISSGNVNNMAKTEFFLSKTDLVNDLLNQ